MAKTLAEQIASMRRVPEAQAPADSAPPPTAEASIVWDLGNARGRFEIPRNLVEAELRLRECEESIASIDRQIQDADPLRPGFEEWKPRAESRRRRFEHERGRIETCIRVFRQESASDRATFAILERERDEARESCRRLADEVQRLTESLSAFRSAAVHAAFVDVAQMVLSEVTFQRILERAKDRAKR